ncbi:MAG: nitrilase-related carbon-nitrogen hydrolase [Phycisphaerae bacterium]
MRVALLQIELDATSRSRNVQRVMAAIDRAARNRPAPDMLVLPSMCDSAGIANDRSSTPRGLTGMAETISWAARDWGIFIVCGLHARASGGWVPCTVLFDADGDAVASTGASFAGDADAAEAGVVVWPCAQGRIIVGESVTAVRSLAPSAVSGALVSVPLPLWLTGHARAEEWKAVESLVRSDAERGDAYWGLVGAVDAESPCATCVLGPLGPPLGEIKPGEDDAVVIVNVPIEPARRATA